MDLKLTDKLRGSYIFKHFEFASEFEDEDTAGYLPAVNHSQNRTTTTRKKPGQTLKEPSTSHHILARFSEIKLGGSCELTRV